MTDYNAILDSISNYHQCKCEPKEKKFSKSKSPNVDQLERKKTRKAELEKVQEECREAIETIQQTVDLDEPTLILLAKHFEQFKELDRLVGEATRSKYCLTALTQPKGTKLTYSKEKKK
jgi:hypothetical protein